MSEEERDFAAEATEALLQSDSSDENLGGQILAGLIFGQVRHEDNIADNPPLEHDNAAAAAESFIDSSESEGNLGGRILASILGNQFYREDENDLTRDVHIGHCHKV